ncbi:hypothetical protein GCK72_012662 [Caenorhabditis remanei]|uniref:Bestrophin homolog n=1 Tax=Caenorhabditis remanei TaxID=31234 RepID=A0A6A5GP22_CAERE|nr:hypothetical protein GCK72_012662 [Caenorhabditis remanei]KAF1756209.1 hypothetical protein GCK72_012662 [Caenorhabditis remanei]
MVRIRHIMEMRRACKAPPLLPPKLRKEGSESTDRRGPKDVMDLTFRVNTLAPERYASSSFYLHLYESQDSSEGPWNLLDLRVKASIRSSRVRSDRRQTADRPTAADRADRGPHLFFEYAAIHLNVRLVHIPLTFMLGFFVTIVVDRWRSVFTNIGFIEKDDLEKMYKCETMYNKYWLPTHWANQLVHKAMFETKNVDSVQSMNSVLMNIKDFRQSMEMLTKYDWVPIPIAYPQVVFLAVRVYFIICLISRQYLLSAPPTEAQSIVPIMTILQFVFFVGWMKVAEALLNPLGEDDDDFECNWLIDRNMSTGIEIVDTCHDSCPPLKLEEPDDEKGTMYWCHPTKNGSQAPPTAVAISQHKNPFAKVLNMVHPTTPESSPPSYRLDVPKQ